MAEVEVRTNLPELKRHLDRIGREMSAKVVRSATSAAARIFRKYAQLLAPVLKDENKRKGRVAGALKKNMFIRRSKASTSGKEHYFVGFRRGKSALRKGSDTFYGTFLEGGWIARGPGKRLRGGKRSKALQRSQATGQRYQYAFLAPAFTRGKGEALAKFFAIADKRIQKISQEKTPKL